MYLALELWELWVALAGSIYLLLSYPSKLMYVFSPGALGPLGSLGRLYLAVAELLLPIHVCIKSWSPGIYG